MTPQDLLLEVFCLVDDQLQALDLGRLRRRGPQPKLADSEVITIELVGEFWKLDTDQDLFRHFRRYHTAEFPALAHVNRTTFARQAANLWRVKQLIQQRLARHLAGDDPLWLVDSLPIDACQFARATFCRRFAGQADYGYCHLRKRTFYGFRLHLRTSRDGVILGYQLASARASEKAVLPELGLPAGSVGIGDRNYWSPEMRERLAAGGVTLLAPYYHKSRDPDRQRSARLARCATGSRRSTASWRSGTGSSGRGPRTCGTCAIGSSARSSAIRRWPSSTSGPATSRCSSTPWPRETCTRR